MKLIAARPSSVRKRVMRYLQPPTQKRSKEVQEMDWRLSRLLVAGGPVLANAKPVRDIAQRVLGLPSKGGLKFPWHNKQ